MASQEFSDLLERGKALHEKSDNYNLLVEPWIPILWNNGKPDRVNIRDALTQAGRFQRIAAHE